MTEAQGPDDEQQEICPGVLLSVGSGGVELRPFDPVRRVLTGDARSLGLPAPG